MLDYKQHLEWKNKQIQYILDALGKFIKIFFTSTLLLNYKLVRI